MKKVLLGLMSLFMILAIPFTFVGCDNYLGKTYVLSEIYCYNSKGSENTYEQYVEFFNFDSEMKDVVLDNYGIDVIDQPTFKSYLLKAIDSEIYFGKDGVCVFTYGDNTSFVESDRTSVQKFTGTYLLVNEKLSISFINYVRSSTGAIVVDENDNYKTEDVSKLPLTDSSSVVFVVKNEDKKIVIDLYEGVGDALKVYQRLVYTKA